MPRHTEESGELYDGFVNALRQAAQVDGYGIRELYGQAHLLRIDGPRRAIINVRTDARDGGWWGFTKNVEDDLNNRSLKWFLVLLESTPG